MSHSKKKKNQRKYHRNTTQRVVVAINDVPYLAKDWSPDGISFIQENNSYSRGDHIKGKIDIFDVEEVGKFSGTVVQANDAGLVAIQFLDISSHIFLNLCMTVSLGDDNSTE